MYIYIYVILYRIDVSRLTQYDTVPTYRAIHYDVQNSFIYFIFYPSTITFVQYGMSSDRYLPSVSGGTIRYYIPCIYIY